MNMLKSILLLLPFLLSSCLTQQPHLFEQDEVYRVGAGGAKINLVFWNGSAWEQAGKINVPAGTYLMGRVE